MTLEEILITTSCGGYDSVHQYLALRRIEMTDHVQSLDTKDPEYANVQQAIDIFTLAIELLPVMAKAAQNSSQSHSSDFSDL